MKINILFIIDYFHRTGGTERHLALLARRLPANKFNCKIVVFDLGDNPLIDQIRANKIPVTHIPVVREYTPNALAQAIELSRIIRRNHIDIVQTFHQKSDSYGALIARLCGVRHIISSKRDIGDLKKEWHFFLNRRLRFLFERIIVVADAVGDVVTAKEGIDPSKIVKIYNGVDETAFSPPTQTEIADMKNCLGFNPEDFVVGMVAGFRPEKNHNVFFEGAIRVMDAIPSLKLLAVGGGPLLEHYRSLYSKEIFDKKIIFTDAINDVSSILKAMDVGCLIPGKNEGFSNSILEKMAMGLPLIVSDVGGNAEAVINNQNGLVISPSDKDAFCKALVEIYSDSARRLQMGRRSRQLVEEKFTLQGMCDAHQALYESLIGTGLKQLD